MHWRTLIVLGFVYPLLGPPGLVRAAPPAAAAPGAPAGKHPKGAKGPAVKKGPTLPVTMVSEPPGATVYIDGKDNGARGVATATLKLHLPKGPHKVLLELPGFRPLEKDIEVSKHLEHFSFKLESAAERLLLRTTASEESKDAQIFVDGVSVGTVPTDVEIKPGQHTVEVRKPGFKSYTETLTVNPSEQKTLNVALVAEAKVAADSKRGTLLVSAPHGLVFVDGKELGTPPALAENIDEGEHLVEVRGAPGEAPLWQQKVKVVAGQQNRVTAELAAGTPLIGDSASELVQLKRQYAELKATLDDLEKKSNERDAHGGNRKGVLPTSFVAAASMPGSALPGGVAGKTGFLNHVIINGSVTLRYDWSRQENQADLLQDGIVWNTLRSRIRLGITYDDDGVVTVGVRLTTGLNPNPAAPFVTAGDLFREKSVGFDHAFGSIRPFKDRDRLSLSFGSIPNPIWRGDRGTFRDQLVWDDDISPEGLALHVTFFKLGPKEHQIKLENSLAYFTLEFTQPFRFIGLTGTTFMVAEQLHFKWEPYIGAALAYYDISNLNNGLRSPFLAAGSAFLREGENSVLLRPGLQQTNNRVSYGPNAAGFVVDQFRIGSAQLQLDLPSFGRLPRLGQPEIYAYGNFTHNFAVSRDSNGWGVTLGIRAGSWEKGALNPLNIWATYRDVDADATLGTIADSDLGGGTAFRGVQVAGNFRITHNLLVQLSYWDYKGFPLKDVRWQHVYLDLVADF
jgi:hypothetical protein